MREEIAQHGQRGGPSASPTFSLRPGASATLPEMRQIKCELIPLPPAIWYECDSRFTTQSKRTNTLSNIVYNDKEVGSSGTVAGTLDIGILTAETGAARSSSCGDT